MMTSNQVRDFILDVDNVQTSSNIYDNDDDDQSLSIITPYLAINTKVVCSFSFETKTFVR